MLLVKYLRGERGEWREGCGETRCSRIRTLGRYRCRVEHRGGGATSHDVGSRNGKRLQANLGAKNHATLVLPYQSKNRLFFPPTTVRKVANVFHTPIRQGAAILFCIHSIEFCAGSSRSYSTMTSMSPSLTIKRRGTMRYGIIPRPTHHHPVLESTAP